MRDAIHLNCPEGVDRVAMSKTSVERKEESVYRSLADKNRLEIVAAGMRWIFVKRMLHWQNCELEPSVLQKSLVGACVSSSIFSTFASWDGLGVAATLQSALSHETQQRRPRGH